MSELKIKLLKWIDEQQGRIEEQDSDEIDEPHK